MKKTTWKTLIGLSVLMTMMVALLSGCNTVEGMGRDLEQAGDTIQDAVE